VPYAMAIAAARGGTWSFLGRVFGHFFDLGVIGVDLKRAFQFFGVLKKSLFLEGFLGGFWMHRFSSWYFGKGVIGLMCYVDIHVGDGFVLGFSFGVVENLVHRSLVFLGVIVFILTANAGPGASLSRLGNYISVEGIEKTVL